MIFVAGTANVGTGGAPSPGTAQFRIRLQTQSVLKFVYINCIDTANKTNLGISAWVQFLSDPTSLAPPSPQNFLDYLEDTIVPNSSATTVYFPLRETIYPFMRVPPVSGIAVNVAPTTPIIPLNATLYLTLGFDFIEFPVT